MAEKTAGEARKTTTPARAAGKAGGIVALATALMAYFAPGLDMTTQGAITVATVGITTSVGKALRNVRASYQPGGSREGQPISPATEFLADVLGDYL